MYNMNTPMGILVLIICISNYHMVVDAFQINKNEDQIFTANLLQAVVDRMNKDYSIGYSDIARSHVPVRTRLLPIKEDEDEPNFVDIIDDDPVIPSVRDNEYLQHSSLWGHQILTEGTGEEKQNHKPKGSIPNKNEVKTDAVLPAYCNPPNPCPMGFSANDGCIQHFENSAAFSRKYQASQKCMCDSEHMFDCPITHEYSPYDNDLEFDFMNNEKSINLKKEFPNKINQFLQGKMLPIAAKKGVNIGF